VGDVAGIQLTNIDGKKVSLKDYPEARVILVFTCNHCPFSIAYEDRIIGLHNKYAAKRVSGGSHQFQRCDSLSDDSFETIVVKQDKIPFPLSLMNHEIARNYGATRTPHVYVK
jgi:glutathione peroxidase-family protein